MARKILEVCIASVDDAITASNGGADRLELNVALELGGLTPSIGLLREVRRTVDTPVIAMLRSRGAGFCYSERERRTLLRDAEHLFEFGALGVATGALTSDSAVHESFIRELVELAGRREVVFHRAFDLIPDQQAALEQLIDLGVARILTSGASHSALAGARQVHELRRQAAQRIQILPGSGVSAENISELIRATGCDQVHGSFSRHQRDDGGTVASDSYPVTCSERVSAARRVLDNCG